MIELFKTDYITPSFATATQMKVHCDCERIAVDLELSSSRTLA